jgi:hypothetical protein
MTNSSDEVPRALEELRRQRRLIDQGLTMQARLRDQDQVIGTMLLCAILVLSVIGAASAFAGPDHLVTIIGIRTASTTWLGWVSICTFALVLVELVLDRRGSAQRHADAVRVLGSLKAEYRVPPAAGEEIAAAARISERYAQAMESIPAVPERAFNRLKAAHLRKVEVSKLLSEQPGMSYRRACAAVARSRNGAGK